MAIVDIPFYPIFFHFYKKWKMTSTGTNDSQTIIERLKWLYNFHRYLAKHIRL